MKIIVYFLLLCNISCCEGKILSSSCLYLKEEYFLNTSIYDNLYLLNKFPPKKPDLEITNFCDLCQATHVHFVSGLFYGTVFNLEQ
jgi:hypothetical protein